MPDVKKSDHGIVERAVMAIVDAISNNGAGKTIKNRPREIDEAVDDMTGARDRQTTDSNNR